MDNQEILNRFDVLYNNITSSQAPGLDGYEKSVFWNKATLEVLKNHLNPKGNKYGEGFDGSSKRQIDFSSLVSEYDYSFPIEVTVGGYSGTSYVCNEWNDNPLCVLNERLDVITSKQHDELVYYLGTFITNVFAASGGLDVITGFINWLIGNKIHDPVLDQVLQDAYNALLLDDSIDLTAIFNPEPSIAEALEFLNIKPRSVVVVPINNVEYDTLMSRPYKYPPKSQAWRVLMNGVPEFTVAPADAPIAYHSRYVKMPAEVNLESNVNSEVPEILHDEILQRAVELAKAAYVGDANQQQIIQTLGERSE